MLIIQGERFDAYDRSATHRDRWYAPFAVVAKVLCKSVIELFMSQTTSNLLSSFHSLNINLTKLQTIQRHYINQSFGNFYTLSLIVKSDIIFIFTVNAKCP